MKIILLSFVCASLGMVCGHLYERPFHARISCEGHRPDCHTYVLPNGIHIDFDQTYFYYFRGMGSTGITCTLTNPSPGKLAIDRDEFAVVSSQGIRYVAEPFRSVDSPRTTFERSTTYPSVYTVESNRTAHYVFAYTADKKYPTREMQDIFKTDVVYFLHTSAGLTDTLFHYVADDSRLK